MFECIYGEGCASEALSSMPLELRSFIFKLTPERPRVMVGRQHQNCLFETALMHRRDLMGFVSRSHLQVQSDGQRGLYVTNLSQNIALVGASILESGQSSYVKAGDTLSFAAQVELLRGGEAAVFSASTANACEGKELAQPVSVAPFFTFRVMPAVLKVSSDATLHGSPLSEGGWFAPRCVSSGGA